MINIPASWLLIGGLMLAVVSYILYVQWQRKRAEKKAAQAIAQRDNARVEQHATAIAQDAEHAYQQASDEVLHQAKSSKTKSMLDKLNNLSPLLLCLLIVGCASEPKIVEINPVKQVVLPSMQPLESWRFIGIDGGYYCLDNNNADAFYRNYQKRSAHIKGLEAMLFKLGAQRSNQQ